MPCFSHADTHVQRISYAGALWLGRLLARMRFNRVVGQSTPAGMVYHKTRYWYSELLVVLTRCSDTPFVLLPYRTWVQREHFIYRHLYGEAIQVAADGGIRMAARPGVRVATLLLTPTTSREMRLQSIRAAVQALWRLHQVPDPLHPQPPRPLSHADATTRNVTYDPNIDSAWWFDFETTHRSGRSATWCRADDLHTLLASAAALLPHADIPHLPALLTGNYPDDGVMIAVCALALQRQRQPDPRILARTRIDAQRSQLLTQALCSACIDAFSQ